MLHGDDIHHSVGGMLEVARGDVSRPMKLHLGQASPAASRGQQVEEGSWDASCRLDRPHR